MNKDNAKDYLPLIQAMAEGKTIQMHNGDYWFDEEELCFDGDVNIYRIKPEVEYVPFDTAEELIDCWHQKMFNGKPIYNTELGMPLISVKHKQFSDSKLLLVGFENNCVSINGCYYKLETVFEYYTFLDGTPIGKIKE